MAIIEQSSLFPLSHPVHAGIGSSPVRWILRKLTKNNCLLFQYILSWSYLTMNVNHFFDIYLQAEEAPIMRSCDSRWGLEPLARFAQEVTKRPDRWDSDRARASSQNQHVIAPPTDIHQRVVLLLIWDTYGETYGQLYGGCTPEEDNNQ